MSFGDTFTTQLAQPATLHIRYSQLDPRAPSNFGAASTCSKTLSLTSRVDNRPDDLLHEINRFHTGITFDIPHGLYITVYGSPQLLNHGYFLPQTFVVDSSMNGKEVIVDLYKYKDVEDLDLPFEACVFTDHQDVVVHKALIPNMVESFKPGVTPMQMSQKKNGGGRFN